MIRTVNLPGPAGFLQEDTRLYVALWRRNSILVLDLDLQPITTVSHRYLNDPHTVRHADDGLLVASTGLDAIIVIDRDGKLNWSWFAFDHEFTHDQLGRRRRIDLDADHRERDYPTLSQTTHINSATQDPADPDTIYASLFHQGAVLRISRRSGDTNMVDYGLDHCHSIRPTAEGFVVCDTRGGRLLRYDTNFVRTNSVPVKGNWIADAWPTPYRGFLVVDGDRARIVEIDAVGNPLAEMRFDPCWKAFQVEPFDAG